MPAPQRPRAQLEDPPQMLIIAPARLREHRRAKRMGLREVAEHVHMSHTQIANYENGVTKTIKEDTAGRLARFIGFAMEDVFGIEPAFPAPPMSNGSRTIEHQVPA